MQYICAVFAVRLVKNSMYIITLNIIMGSRRPGQMAAPINVPLYLVWSETTVYVEGHDRHPTISKQCATML